MFKHTHNLRLDGTRIITEYIGNTETSAEDFKTEKAAEKAFADKIKSLNEDIQDFGTPDSKRAELVDAGVLQVLER